MNRPKVFVIVSCLAFGMVLLFDSSQDRAAAFISGSLISLYAHWAFGLSGKSGDDAS